MRKLPMPKHLNLTRTTCEDLYSHRRGFRHWFRARMDNGKLWYTNGHVCMDRKPPYKGCEQFISDAELPLHKDPLERVALQPVFIGGDIPIPMREAGDYQSSVLVQSWGARVETRDFAIATRYVELMRGTYPGCKFRAAGQRDALEVLDASGKLVAYVMPIRL